MSNFQFLFDGAQTLLLDRNAISDEVAQGTHQGKKTNRFEVDSCPVSGGILHSWNDTQANKIRLEDEDSEDAQANGDDAEVAWKTARRANKKQENGKSRPEDKDEQTIGDVERPGSNLEIVRGNGHGSKSDLDQEHYAKEDSSPGIDILQKDAKSGDDNRIRDEPLDVEGQGVGNLKKRRLMQYPERSCGWRRKVRRC